MTKQDLIKKIASESGMQQQQVTPIIDAFTEAIKDCYKKGERVEIKSFGVFVTKVRKARKARNMQTGELIDVPEKKVLVFKPSIHIND